MFTLFDNSLVDDREEVPAAGFDGDIAKPLDPETLVSQVESFRQGTAADRRVERG